MKIVATYFLREEEWPSVQYVEVELLNEDLDIEDIISRFNMYNSDIFAWYTTNLQGTDKIYFSVKALSYCSEAQVLLTEFTKAVQFFSTTYYNQLLKTSQFNNSFKEADLKTIVPDEYLPFIGKLIKEGANFYNSFATGSGNGWFFEPNRDLLRYRKISTIQDYIAIRNKNSNLQISSDGSSEIQNPLPITSDLEKTQSVIVQSNIPFIIKNSLEVFKRDFPDSSKVGFIMMQFAQTDSHNEIAHTIKEVLVTFGLTGVRADDREYHQDLFQNIETYLYGCGFGIAVFERINNDQHNPNIALETGYMMALKKPICILKDRTLTALQADLVGRLYKPFDVQHISSSIRPVLTKWLEDYGFKS